MSSLTSRLEHKTRRLIATCAAALSGTLALAAGAGEASAGWTCSQLLTDAVDANIKAASYSGRPHVFYNVWQPSTHLLRTTYPTDVNHTVWTHQTVAGDPSLPGQHAGYNSPGEAVTYDGAFYFPYTDTFHGDLKVAYKTSVTGAWTHIGVDGNGENAHVSVGNEPAAVVFDDKLYVFYTAGSGAGYVLRVAVYDGSTWSYQLIDNTGGISKPRAIVHDATLRVYYQQTGTSGNNVRQAVSTNGTTWSVAVLDGDGGVNGRTTDSVGGDIAVTSHGSPFGSVYLKIFYTNDTERNLRVAHFDGTAHTFSVVDGPGGIASGATSGDIGYRIDAISYSEELLGSRKPYVFYTDHTNHTVRAAWLDGSSWSAIKLDGATSGNACSGAVNASTGVSSPTAVLGSGGILVFYTAGNLGSPVRRALFTP
ncbi:hypothetical protein [Sorangium sp. So ce341]|uniref:hypothetical protein n=1 Tax=Sorangium sp. So ce341 TaxID=3133302 RepID=UPI003F63698B